MPDYSLLKDIKIDDIEIATMLKAINERIECLYDRDHTIGHAYFIGIKSMEELSDVFRNRIIPLLCEYFYDDWEKIRLILADVSYTHLTQPTHRRGCVSGSAAAMYEVKSKR